MFKRNFFTLSVVVLAIVLLTACQQSAPPFECTDAIGCVEIPPGEPVKIGVLQALSGGAASLGITQSRMIELALDKRDGQLLGHPITLQIEDSKCTSEGGTIAALKVAADPQVVAILGTSCSGAATTASKVASEVGLVMVSGSNTAPSLTSIGGEQGADWQPGYFRASSNDSVMGYAAATIVFQAFGTAKAATINDGDVFTQGLTDVLGQTFTELGGQIVLDATVNKGETDMQPVLEAVADSGAELLFFPLFQPEGDLIVLQAREMPDLEEVILMSSTALLVDDFVNVVGQAGLGVYFIGDAEPRTPASDELRAAFEAKYGEPPPHGTFGQGYDAANLLLQAIETTAIQEANGTLHIGRQALRDTLYATSDFEGVTGKLSCDEFGDCGINNYYVSRLDDSSAGAGGVKSNVIYSYRAGEWERSN